MRVLDRLDCGWLVLSTAKQFGSGEVGVLLPDGRFTVRGNSDGLVGLSEDRSRIALTRDERIVVTDLDTGDEVASTPAPAGAVPFAWNQSGVWFGYESGDAIHLNVWQPGSQPRSVTWTGGDIFPVRDTDLLIAPEDVPCVQVLRLQPDGTLATVMKRCDPNQGQASLSPDGRILVTSSGKAYRVHDNTPLEYTVPDGLGSPAGHLSPAIWEDSTHLLLDSTMGMDDETGRRIIVRCDVISGSCERLYDANRASELVLGRP